MIAAALLCAVALLIVATPAIVAEWCVRQFVRRIVGRPD